MKPFAALEIKRKAVLIMFSVYLAALILLGTMFFFVYKYEKLRELEKVVEETLSETSERLNTYLKSTDERAYNVLYSNWTQRVYDKGLSNFEREKRIANIQEVMNSLSFLASDVQIAVFMKDGTRFHSNEWFGVNQDFYVENQGWFQELEDHRKYVWAGEDQQVFYNYPEWCILSWYAIHNIDTLDREAYAAVRIPLDTLEKDVFEGHGYHECYLLFLDPQGNPLYSELPEQFKDEEKELMQAAEKQVGSYRGFTVMRKDIPLGEEVYSIVGVLENSKVPSAGIVYWIVFLGILAFIGLILSVLSYALSHYITRPIMNIRDGMKEISNNNLDVVIDNPYQDEFGEMIDSFNQMSTSIHELIRINQNISMMQKDAEYQLLERQINPHFLFNNLELINSLILGEKLDEARTVCETLGELYRYNLQKRKFITLEEEMEYTRNYLFLMTYKIRNLSFFYDMDENVGKQMVPKVILQPLVENAIKHGFSDLNRDYCITLLAKSLKEGQDGIRITVMDNGTGIHAEKLAAIREEIEYIQKNPQTVLEGNAHIGLKNVVQRLALEYDSAFSISISSKEGFGTRIELTIREEKD